MICIQDMKLPPGYSEEMLKQKIRKILRGITPESFEIRKRSLDARDHRNIRYHITVSVRIAGITSPEEEKKFAARYPGGKVVCSASRNWHFPVKGSGDPEDTSSRPVIIGAGPAGYFAALELAEAGFHPLVLERGKAVEERTKDVQQFWDTGMLNPESNVSFGEGGAGTFSDGKLFTGNKDKTGIISHILHVFRRFGADPAVTFDAKPHIGTDVLFTVMQNMRQAISSAGGTIRFGTKVISLKDEIRVKNTAPVWTVTAEKDGKIISLETPLVILAIGHSARDTFSMLEQKGVSMTPKPFAVGLRVEHLQETVNRAMYGSHPDPELPPADYKLVTHTSGGKSVFSFCMCPGGYVVNASSDPESVVVNGMSYHSRDGENANSAIVVSVNPEDYGARSAMDAVSLQKKLEYAFYKAGLFHGVSHIPVQRYGDFITGTPSSRAGRVTPRIRGKYLFTDISHCLPPDIREAILEAMPVFGKKIDGFDDPDALFSGVESRTSSPVRILRGKDMMAENHPGLIPAGEGAGYAGGITSAAADGIRAAEAAGFYLLGLEKKRLRKSMIRKRNELLPEDVLRLSGEICRRILQTEAYRNATAILAYESIRNEVSLSPLIRQALRDGKHVYLPKVTGNETMEFRMYAHDTDLKPGPFHIPEPEKGRVFCPGSADALMLVPGTVFSTGCGRTGYGAGYYDRYIRAAGRDKMFCMGVAYGFQIRRSVPEEPTDERLDAVVSETGILQNPAAGNKPEEINEAERKTGE